MGHMPSQSCKFAALRTAPEPPSAAKLCAEDVKSGLITIIQCIMESFFLNQTFRTPDSLNREFAVGKVSKKPVIGNRVVDDLEHLNRIPAGEFMLVYY